MAAGISRININSNFFDWDNLDNYPEDLINTIIDSISKNGNKTDRSNIVIAFPFSSELNRRTLFCFVIVRFTNTKKWIQYFIFRKTKLEGSNWGMYGEWKPIKSSEIMSPERRKKPEDLSLVWKDV